MLSNLAEEADNKIAGIIDKANKRLTNGLGTEYLDQQWDAINAYDDAFKDPIERMLGIQDVKNAYKEALEGLEGDPKALKRINNLLDDQLELLENKNSLTQYDLDRAKVLLEVEKAQMALEQARNNKTKMRLRRDSQGNYTYQYVADEQNTANLEKRYLDAQASLYQSDKEHYLQTVNQYKELYAEYQEQYVNLQKALQTANDEEAKVIQKQIDLLIESKNKMDEAIREDNDINKNTYLRGSVSNIIEDDQNWQNYITYANSEWQNLINNIDSQGGLVASWSRDFAQVDNITENLQSKVDLFLKAAGTSADEILNANSELLQQTVDALAYTNKAVQESLKQVQGVEKVIVAAQSFVDQYYDEEKISSIANLLYKTTKNILQSEFGAEEDDLNNIIDKSAIKKASLTFLEDIDTLTDDIYKNKDRKLSTINQALKENLVERNITSKDLGYERTYWDIGQVRQANDLENLSDNQYEK